MSLGRAFVTDPATDGTMIHGDLHYENVLAAEREPWLVIDPKPMSGDPHYEVAPLLWNRWDEVVASGDVRRAVRNRFHATIDTAGLDEDRARDWVVVRMVHNAMWCIEDSPDGLDDESRECSRSASRSPKPSRTDIPGGAPGDRSRRSRAGHTPGARQILILAADLSYSKYRPAQFCLGSPFFRHPPRAATASARAGQDDPLTFGVPHGG